MVDKNLMASMDAVIVAVDNGNGNTKTEHCVFRTGLDEYDGEPTVTKDYFKINGRYYVAGENHMTYQGNKTENDDCYILTMIAVVKELKYRHITSAKVILALGLPLAWCGSDDKAAFKAYMNRESEINVEHGGDMYHIEIEDVLVYPQGFSAVVGRYDMSGFNMIVDIGDGTLDIMQINNGKPIESSLHTEKKGIGTCMKEIRQELSRLYKDDYPEEVVDPFLRNGCGNDNSDVASITRRIALEYAEDIIKTIKAVGYKDSFMNLYIIGGGGCILKNFSDITSGGNVHVIGDVCANAKGYAYLAKQKYGK